MPSVLLIVSGSVAAYKSLDILRRLRDGGVTVRTILTRGAAEFVTPLSFAALSGEPVYQELFSLKDETEMGHIRLVREADLVLVAPASADLMARMAHGLADELATAALLANTRPLLLAPAMNSAMWNHPATRRNLAQLEADGAVIVPPECGLLACGEEGQGRMAEVEMIINAVTVHLADEKK